MSPPLIISDKAERRIWTPGTIPAHDCWSHSVFERCEWPVMSDQGNQIAVDHWRCLMCDHYEILVCRGHEILDEKTEVVVTSQLLELIKAKKGITLL